MKHRGQLNKTILITGGAGYIGSFLVRDMLAQDYRVRCLDLLIYGDKSLQEVIRDSRFELIHGDIRDKKIVRRALKDVDSVIHLAAIVGDSPCQAAPKSAVEINFKGTRILAEEACTMGVNRFIFNSTCSNYGIMKSSEDAAEENHEFNPISLYAETKIDCEEFLKTLNGDQFCVTVLRFASGYGISYRTRFDLLINSLAFEAWTKNEVTLFSADTWRPYVHVADMCLIIRKVLEAPLDKVAGEIFNAGSTIQNYTKRMLIKILQKRMPQLRVRFIDTIDDRRNYKVDFNKLKQKLCFKPTKTIDDAFEEFLDSFNRGHLTKDDFALNKIETLESFFKEKEQDLQSLN
ncbi:MAG: NAD(P)-dependent oxidoreductase [Deltaproteobacteria bacterium]|nr:NAD(P)-dependent oxidoreductase [Deltaproteobacteria bacterium]